MFYVAHMDYIHVMALCAVSRAHSFKLLGVGAAHKVPAHNLQDEYEI